MTQILNLFFRVVFSPFATRRFDVSSPKYRFDVIHIVDDVGGKDFFHVNFFFL